MVTSGFVDVEGTRLYYEVAGSGTPVVLLHGGMLNLRQWDEQFDILAKEFLVIRYDARGYGRSALGSAPYSHHEDLAALLRALDVERPHLVALSNGAARRTPAGLRCGTSSRCVSRPVCPRFAGASTR